MSVWTLQYFLYLPVRKGWCLLTTNDTHSQCQGKSRCKNGAHSRVYIRSLPSCLPETWALFFSDPLISWMCQSLFRRWLSLSASFLLCSHPRFPAKDGKNTVLCRLFFSVWNLSNQMPDQWQRLELARGTLVTCGVNPYECTQSQSRWPRCACRGGHLVQTPEARCARLFAYAELSRAACMRLISTCTTATFHIHRQLKLRAVRKLVSSETGIWEKWFSSCLPC